MKPLMYLALILSGFYFLVSLPILTILWLFGANSPFNNLSQALTKMIFEEDIE